MGAAANYIRALARELVEGETRMSLRCFFSSRHQGTMLTVARCLWPRGFVRRYFSSRGLFLLIEARA